jgi:hypothetical protein
MSAQDVAASAVDAVSKAASVAQPVLTQALANLINKTVEAAQAGGQFLVDQVPDVIRQLLLYKAIVSGLLCLLGVILLVTGIGLVLYIRKNVMAKTKGWVSGYYNEWSFWPCALTVLSVGCLVAGSAFAAINWDWLEIWIAPKLYLIEYATDLIKVATGHGS